MRVVQIIILFFLGELILNLPVSPSFEPANSGLHPLRYTARPLATTCACSTWPTSPGMLHLSLSKVLRWTMRALASRRLPARPVGPDPGPAPHEDVDAALLHLKRARARRRRRVHAHGRAVAQAVARGFASRRAAALRPPCRRPIARGFRCCRAARHCVCHARRRQTGSCEGRTSDSDSRPTPLPAATAWPDAGRERRAGRPNRLRQI